MILLRASPSGRSALRKKSELGWGQKPAANKPARTPRFDRFDPG